MYAISLSLLMMFMYPYYFKCMLTPYFTGWTHVPLLQILYDLKDQFVTKKTFKRTYL